MKSNFLQLCRISHLLEKYMQDPKNKKMIANLVSIFKIEYNNFNFGNKEKMTFKMQVVYDAGPNSRFRRLAPKLEIGKLVFITGFLDLNDNDLPFIDGKRSSRVMLLFGEASWI